MNMGGSYVIRAMIDDGLRMVTGNGEMANNFFDNSKPTYLAEIRIPPAQHP